MSNGMGKIVSQLGPLAFVLASTSFLAGCGESPTLTAQAFPSSIVLGEGPVTLKGEVGPNPAFADYEWRLIGRPEGSEATIDDALNADASFVPDVEGEYELRFTATVGSTRSGGGLASGIGGRSAVSTQLSVVALPRPAGRLSFVVQPSNGVAGSAFQPPVAVELQDSEGKKLTEAIGVALAILGGEAEAEFVGTATATTVDGVATFAELGIDLAGRGYALKATAAGIDSATSEPFDIVAGQPDPALSTFAATPAKVGANGDDFIELELVVRDAFGNPVSGIDVTFVSDGDTFSPAAAGPTDETGVFSARLTSTRAGFRTVKALFGDARLSADVQFEVGAADERASSIRVTPEEATPDGVSTAEILVAVSDAFGNPVVGERVTLAVTGTGNVLTPSGTLSTDEEGKAVFLLASTVAETKGVTASLAGFALFAEATFTSVHVDDAKSEIFVEPNGTVADNQSEITVSVKLVDAQLNPVAGVPVVFSSSAAEDVFSPTTPVNTDAQGGASARVRSTLAGTRRVQAAFRNRFLEADIVFVAGAANRQQSTFVAAPQSLAADDHSASTLTLVLKDAFGNVIRNEPVTFAVSGTGNALDGKTGNTDAEGRRTATLKSSVAGDKTVTATFGNPAQNWTTTVTFTEQVALANKSELTATGPVNADGRSQSQVAATLRDMNGRAVPGVRVAFASSHENDEFSNREATTNAQGVASTMVSSTEVGTRTLTASWAGDSKTTELVFVAGAASAETTTLTVLPDRKVSVSETPNLTLAVRVADAFDNPLKDVEVRLGLGTETTLLKTDGDGKASFKTNSTIAGARTATAEVAGFVKTEEVEFLPGEVASATLDVDHVERVADDQSVAVLTFRLKDEYDNAVPGTNVTFTSDGTNHTLSPAKTTSDSEGVATATIRSKKAETKNVGARAGDIEKQVAVRFVSGPPDNGKSTFTATPVSVPADGVTSSALRLVVKDKFENPVAGEKIFLSASASGVSFSSTPVTNTLGVATSAVRSTRQGAVKLTATSERGLEKEANVNFTSLPPRVSDLTVAVEGACGLATFSVEPSDWERIEFRYEFEGGDGHFRTATPAAPPKAGTFHWDMETDLRGTGWESVTFIVTPVVDGDDGVPGKAVVLAPSFPVFGETVTLGEVENISGVSAVRQQGNPNIHLRVTDQSAEYRSPTFFHFQNNGGTDWVRDERIGELPASPIRHLMTSLGKGGGYDTISAYSGEKGALGWFEIKVVEDKREPAIFYYSDFTVIDLVVADVNNDGRPDVVVVGMAPEGYVLAIAQQGEDFFPSELRILEYIKNAVPTGLAVGDVSGDGFPDIVVSESYGGLMVMNGDGTGKFSSFAFHLGATLNAHSPVIVDNSGKGWADVLVASRFDSSVAIFANNGAGSFNSGVLAEGLHEPPVSLSAGDFTGNGRLDALVALMDGTIHLVENDRGVMKFVEFVAKVPPDPIDVVVADFNNDGRLDFATANTGGRVGTVSVVYGSMLAECKAPKAR